jgi:hypothetical protein
MAIIDHSQLFSNIPSWMIELLNETGSPYAICGGAVRDHIRGIAPKDYDIMSLASTRELLDRVKRRRSTARIKAPYNMGGMGKTDFPIHQWVSREDVEQVVIHDVPLDLWSAREYGWTEPKIGAIDVFDYTCNAIAVWNNGHVSATDEVIDHIVNGKMRMLDPKRACRPHRLAHMQAKGFELVTT